VKLWLFGAFLLALLALAVSLQRHASPPVAPDESAARLPAGWGSVVLGAPSGAEPPSVAPATPAPLAPEVTRHEAPVAPELELVVAPGQSLSLICKEHYGTASVALVESLARFNQLESANSVRAGQKLRLPPLEMLQKR
jgi:nucleoid-associated protein YgaU